MVPLNTFPGLLIAAIQLSLVAVALMFMAARSRAKRGLWVGLFLVGATAWAILYQANCY
jgi:hypothetical protein